MLAYLSTPLAWATQLWLTSKLAGWTGWLPDGWPLDDVLKAAAVAALVSLSMYLLVEMLSKLLPNMERLTTLLSAFRWLCGTVVCVFLVYHGFNKAAELQQMQCPVPLGGYYVPAARSLQAPSL